MTTSPQALGQIVPPTTPPVTGLASPTNPLPTLTGHSLAKFINDAHSAGYGSIDPNIITTIGSQMGNNNNSKMALAAIKQSQAIPNKTSQYLYESSAVAPEQTTAKVIQDHLNNTGIAPIPIAQIKAMQQQLIDAKFQNTAHSYAAAGAKADGVWSPAWASAAYQYNLDIHSTPGLGNTSSRSLFSTLFDPGFLSYAIPFVSSVIRNVPADGLKALGGGLKLTSDALAAFDKFVGSQPLAQNQATHIANWISNAGQKIAGQAPLTDTEYGAQSNWEHILAIGNTALTLSVLGKLAEETVLGSKGAVAAGKAAGAKNAASALITKVEPMAPKGPLNWVMNSVMPNTADGGARFAFTNWLKNSPTAARLAPNLTAGVNAGLDATATEIKGAYKVARRIAATPYNRPITAIAGQAASSVSTAGLKLGLLGNISNWMGDPNTPVATELDHLKPIAGMTGLALNLSQIAAHGDLGSVPALSESVGNIFAQGRSIVATALDKNGLLADWERGTGVSANKTIKGLVKEGLTPHDFYAHVQDQADTFAAQHAAQPLVDTAIQNGSLDKTNADAVHLAQLNQAHIIRMDPELMAEARASYFQKPGLFAKDVANSMLHSREDARVVHSKDLATFLKARRLTQGDVYPNIAHFNLPKAPVDDTSWMSALAPERIARAKESALAGQPIEGKFGLIRNDVFDAASAEAKAMEFAKELEKVKPDYVAPQSIEELKISSDGREFGSKAKAYQMPRTHVPDTATPAETELRGRVLNVLGSELGRNIHDLNYVPTQDLIKLVAEKANLLARKLTLNADAPQHVIDAVKETNDLGYSHAWGTDIGHVFNNPTVDLKALGTQQNMATRVLDKWGINFTPMADEASVSSIGAKNGLNDVLDAKKAQDPTKLPLWVNGSRLTDYIQSMIKPKIGGVANAAIGVTASPLGKMLTFKGLSLANGGAWKKELQELITQGHYTDTVGISHPITDMGDAKNALRKILTQDSSPQSWTRKDFINALTTKGDGRGMAKDKFGNEVQALGLSTKDASDLWYGMKKGLRSAPAYQSGTNVIGRLMNSTFGLDNVPLRINGYRLLDITSPIQNALIQARYLYSPRQAYLRTVKSALKGVNENMPYSLNASASFKELPQAAQDAAVALTEKVYGKSKTAIDPNDFTTKEFGAKDYFNIFDPQATLERTVHYVSQNMKDERGLVNKIEPNALETNVKLSNQAKQFDNFEDFSKAISLQGLRPRAWHITKDENFRPDVNVKPLDRTGSNPDSVLYVGDPAHWQEYANGRNHVVEYDLSNLKWTKNPLKDKTADFYSDQSGNQGFVIRPSAYGKLKETGRMTVQEAINRAEQQNKAMPNSKQEAEKLWNDIKSPKSVSELTPADYPELKNRVDAINNYGDRTAAEKTLNGFFFPFSFEKTVMRELGSHLLDNPSTRLMVAGAIHVYNSTEGQKMDKWLQDNVPLWKEVEKFNPFYHGSGFGQFGGINRVPEGIIGQVLYGGAKVPDFSKVSDIDKLKLFIHMLQPKPITSAPSMKAAVALLPALRDLNNIFVGVPLSGNAPFGWKTAGGEVRASIQDLAGQAQRAIHSFSQSDPGVFASQSYQPYALQQTNAWARRAKWITELAGALAPGSSYAFGKEVPYVGGMKITRTNINYLVNKIYPDWNPNLALPALARNQAAKDERLNIQEDVKKVGPEYLQRYDAFTQGSDTIQSEISKDSLDPSFDPSAIAAQMTQLRDNAAHLAAANPTFAAFYAKYYASKYGPLKGL